MLTEEHFELFTKYKIRAMGDKLREIVEDCAYDNKTFEERIELMLEAEMDARYSRKVERLAKIAGFKQRGACVEDIVYIEGRSLNRDRIARFAKCDWVADHDNVVIISRTGGGKSYISQALGNAACRAEHSVIYRRLADLLRDLDIARTNGEFYSEMDRVAGVELLILDDFFTTPVSERGIIDLFEILEAREGQRSTMFASQIDPAEWYLRIDAEVIADSILNRITKRARFIDIEGPNMREFMEERRRSEPNHWD
jgi:DNA replication protein DnaC